jgi:ABC-type lipoprotein release transport system permease subunit
VEQPPGGGINVSPSASPARRAARLDPLVVLRDV